MQHDLADYLYTAHRLILEPSKTQILTTGEFRRRELRDPEEVERQSRAQKIKQRLQEILAASGYVVGEDDLLDKDKDKVVRENLVELFEECIAQDPLHLGIARHLLRRATRLRTVALNAPIFGDRIE